MTDMPYQKMESNLRLMYRSLVGLHLLCFLQGLQQGLKRKYISFKETLERIVLPLALFLPLLLLGASIQVIPNSSHRLQGLTLEHLACNLMKLFRFSRKTVNYLLQCTQALLTNFLFVCTDWTSLVSTWTLRGLEKPIVVDY